MEDNVQHRRFDDEKRVRGVESSTPESMTKLTSGHLSPHTDKDNSIPRSNQVEEEVVSDSESVISGTRDGETAPLFGSGFVRLDEEDALHQVISHKFVSDLARYGMHTHIETIHRNPRTSATAKAKLQCYLHFLGAMEKKNDGNANWKYAWYCSSKQDISTIISHGFGHTVNSGIYGRGIYLSPVEYPLQSLQFSTVDEDGLRHLLLCRVLLGRTEVIHPGSDQCHPSSEEFDSGVDNLVTPTKYIIWCTHMNTHILPEFVISIRAPPVAKESKRFSIPLRKPSSPWMPFPTLISTLAQFLTPDRIKLIQKHHIDHKERKITREELIKRVRQITGDELLVRVIKSYKDKLDASKGSKPIIGSAKCHQQRGGDCACSKNQGFKFC